MLRTSRRATSGFAVVAVLAVLALAGCAPASPAGVASLGDGGDSAGATPTATPNGGDSVKFAECMREQGIDMPNPDPDEQGFNITIPEGTSKEEVDAAMEACKEFQPNGGEPMQLNAEQLAQMREFSECMREHGIENFPDPSADGGIMIESNPGDPNSIDPESQEFKDAQAACESLAPAPPDGEDSGPSTQKGSGS